MDSPFFSVIIPTYNRGKFIQRTIESVLNQYFKNFELIIVDNKSTDNTKQIILSFNDERIKFIENDNNYERCYSRNVGIINSKGNYLLFLDSDDYIESNHLSNWFFNISSTLIRDSFFISNKKIETKEGIILGTDFDLNNEIKTHFFLINVVLPGQVCIHSSIIKKYRFNTEYLIFEDTALWLILSKDHTPFFFNFNSYVYCIHDSNSVDWKINNYGKRRYKSLVNFKKNNPELVELISHNFMNQEISNALFTVAKYFIFKSKLFYAFCYLLRSIITYPAGNQLKHKIFILISLFIPYKRNEYMK
jgi:glycosyltransferase involved in cell wall biosynthesis